MVEINKLMRMTIAVGIMTTISLVFTILALTDIHSGAEPDLSNEWAIVRVSFFIVPLFIALTMACIWRASKNKA